MKQSIKQASAKVASSEKARFGLVGVVNTMVDFVVLNILFGLFALPLAPSNIVSTTVAMCVSFALNKKAVFQGSERGGIRQIVLFFVVTLAGIWLIQTVVLVFVHSVIVQLLPLPEIVAVTIAKVIGICAGLVWNYLWYSRVVFKSGKK